MTALMSLPGAPPPPSNWHSARLPINYEQAKAALANCERIDECVEWARKAEALASYYRQSVDQTFHNLALRIKLRAERRYGELLLEMDGSEDARTQAWEMARASGITAAQLSCAKRIAKLPTEQFEEIVNQERVPHLSTAVAKLGRTERMGRLRRGHANKEDFKEVQEFLWRLYALGLTAKETSPASLAAGIRHLWGKVDGQRHIEGSPNDIERMGLPEYVSRLSQFLAAVSKEYWKLEQGGK